MNSVTDLVNPDEIERLSLPSNHRYGQAIYSRRAVEFITFESLRVEAWAGGLDGSMREGGGQRRRVELAVTPAGLTWHCTGNPKNHQIFCKHCVATALAVWNKAPKKE